MDQNMTERQQRYEALAVEALDLNVLRAHDRMVAEEIAAKFMALADAECAESCGSPFLTID